LPERAFRFVPLSGVTALGVDELSYGHGQKYLTLVYQLDHGNQRLLWIGLDRTKKTLGRFFTLFGKEFSDGLRFACSDMWRPYLDVIAECAPKALNILDRFHVMKQLPQTNLWHKSGLGKFPGW
jgi:transposase